MNVSDCLIYGGIPDDWTPENLRWLAQAHRRVATRRWDAPGDPRPKWHQRWAALIEDMLETARVHRH